MYTIIGGDGAEYGPVSADQLRAWIAAKRASLDTMAKAQGSDEWKRLGEFPEFMPGAETAAPEPSAAPIMTETSAAEIASQILAQGGRMTIGDSLERSWLLLKGNFWPIVGVTFVTIVLQIAASQLVNRLLLPKAFTGAVRSEDLQLGLSSFFLFGSGAAGMAVSMLFSGLYYYFLKQFRGETATLKDAFSGFSRLAVPLILAGLLMGLFIVVGMLCLILPGLYLAVAYAYTPILILDKKLSVWTAMEVSRRLISAQWFRILGLMLVGALLQLVGLICLGVGLLVTIPLVTGGLVASYAMIVEPRRRSTPAVT